MKNLPWRVRLAQFVVGKQWVVVPQELKEEIEQRSEAWVAISPALRNWLKYLGHFELTCHSRTQFASECIRMYEDLKQYWNIYSRR